MSDEWWNKPRWENSDGEDQEDPTPNPFNFNNLPFSESQLQEARILAAELGISITDALVRLLGVSNSDSFRKLPNRDHANVDLDRLRIPDAVIKLITESMAREDMVIAVGLEGHAVLVAMHNPNNTELVDKLRFVLNREIAVAVASPEAIVRAINRHYK